MSFIRKYIGDLFLAPRFFVVLAFCGLCFLLAYFLPGTLMFAFVPLILFVLLFQLDYTLLFFTSKRVSAQRITPARLSNGEENDISLILRNDHNFTVRILAIDEFPVQLQIRNWERKVILTTNESRKLLYTIVPTERGEYLFGDVLLYISTLLGLISRRIKIDAAENVPVFPAFLNLKKYDIISNATLSFESGSKRIKKIGQSMEFEQIKEYVSGDDIRILNWKASARNASLMVNHFMEERSQQVYCIIDKGRLMKMPFEGLTLLDYSINSALALSGISLKKQDRVGLITFSSKLGSVLAADRRPVQRERILQILYKEQTAYLESDFEMLYLEIRNKIRNRSLLLLFTNFESLSGLERQLKYLRAIAKHHLLLVIFFENTELHSLAEKKVDNIEGLYIKTIAEKFAYEKRLIARELSKYGILSILTPPQKLTINTINKYLELKKREAI